MSVSIVAAAWRRFIHAARWKGQAPHVTTGAASTSESHCQLSNWRSRTIASASTGSVRTAAPTRRWRSWRRRRSCSSGAGSDGAAPGSPGDAGATGDVGVAV
jgi:hypothetical protein